MASKYISIWFACLALAALGLAGSQPSAAGICCFPAVGACQDASDGYATEADCIAVGGTWDAAYTNCPTSGACACGELSDCNGNCAPLVWLGDGWCDDGAYSWHGNAVHYDCAAYFCDEGDCDPAAHPDCASGCTCPNYDWTLYPDTSWQTDPYSTWAEGCYPYRIEVEAGWTYVAKTGCGDGATADFDTVLHVYDSSCNLVALDDDACESGRSLVTWTASANGYNYIILRDKDGAGPDDYTLAYRREAGGACCVGGACYEYPSEADCLAASGTWMAGHDTCPDSGTCLCGEINDCNGNCAPADWLGDGECHAYQYAWHGNAISFYCEALAWDDGDCAVPEGVCCYDDSGVKACLDVGFGVATEADCDAWAGTWLPGYASCPIDGSCLCGEINDCNGNCVIDGLVGDTGCDDGSWSWHGNPIRLDCEAFGCDGGDCDAAAHPDCTQGACCFADGSCLFDAETDCVTAGGTYQGNDTDCDPNPCPQPTPTGACCFADGTCEEDEAAADCAAAGGTYQGDGTDCDPNPCPAVSVKASAGSDKSICPGDSVKLSGSASGGTPPYSYSWSPSTGLSGADVAQPMASPTQTTTYTLTVTDAEGKKGSDTVKVSVGYNLDASVVGGHGNLVCGMPDALGGPDAPADATLDPADGGVGQPASPLEPTPPAVNDADCYAEGQVVALTASPDEGYRVKLWTGTDDDSKTTLANTVTMTTNKTVTVEFELITARCTLAVEVEGEGTVSLDPPGGEYDSGTSVKLTAKAKAGWRFDHWEGALSGAANPATLVMSDDKSVTAVFEQGVIQYTLGVTVEGEGTVTLDPPGGTYDAGTSVKLTATPEAGWRFARWKGDAGGTSATTAVTMTRNRSITAVFEPDTPVRYRLSIRIEGEGSVDPPGGMFDAGATVTLNATPEEGWRFARWEGDASGTGTSAAVTMDRNRTVTAVFEENAPDDAGADDGAGRTSPEPCGSACPAASAGLIGVTLARLLRPRGNGRRRVG